MTLCYMGFVLGLPFQVPGITPDPYVLFAVRVLFFKELLEMLKFQKILIKSCVSLSLMYLASACNSDETQPEEIIQATEEVSEPALPEQGDGLLADTETDLAADTALGNFDISSSIVYFDFDDDRVNDEQMFALQQLAEYLTSSGQAVLIEGHCDERGSAEYNLALGERRAYAVKNYLMTLGVSADQLSTVSYGEEKPKAFGQTEEDYAQNRRVEFSSR